METGGAVIENNRKISTTDSRYIGYYDADACPYGETSNASKQFWASPKYLGYESHPIYVNVNNSIGKARWYYQEYWVGGSWEKSIDGDYMSNTISFEQKTGSALNLEGNIVRGTSRDNVMDYREENAALIYIITPNTDGLFTRQLSKSVEFRIQEERHSMSKYLQARGIKMSFWPKVLPVGTMYPILYRGKICEERLRLQYMFIK